MNADDARKLVATLREEAADYDQRHSDSTIHGQYIVAAQEGGVASTYRNCALRIEALLSAPPPTYPHPCGLCEGNVESDDDKDWHGLGNCVPTCDRCTGSGIDPKMPPPLGEAPTLTVEQGYVLQLEESLREIDTCIKVTQYWCADESALTEAVDAGILEAKMALAAPPRERVCTDHGLYDCSVCGPRPGQVIGSPREREYCRTCHKLIMQPNTNYGINPEAVCICGPKREEEHKNG